MRHDTGEKEGTRNNVATVVVPAADFDKTSDRSRGPRASTSILVVFVCLLVLFLTLLALHSKTSLEPVVTARIRRRK